MNFIISSSLLLKHLQIVSRVINSKNTLPILDNFLFQIDENKLSITASDLENTMITTIELETISGNGEFCIDAKRITNFLKEFPDQPLTFNVNEELSIDIVSENGKFSIKGEKGEDFPKIPTLENDVNNLALSSEILLQGISKTIFAASHDELRPVMTGIFVKLSTEDLVFASSDAHKLVRYRRTDIKAENDASLIMPPKSANLLKSMLTKDDVAVSLQFDKKNVKVEFANYKLVSRLLEGNYPNFEAVIPVNNTNKLIVDRLEFYNSLRRVSVFSNQSSNLIKLSITANELVISAQDIDFSISGLERIKCEFEGEDMEIGFKSLFLIEILDNLPTSDIQMNLSNPSTAGVLVPMNSEVEEEDILMLLMPMMV